MQEYSETAAGIYLHIPFCESICPYCDFYSVIPENPEIPGFIDALLMETDRAAEGVFGSFVYDTVYLGGGTPSILNADSMARIMEKLRARFEIKANAEVSVECNPSSFNEEKIKGYIAAGINRISLGVQSFSEKNLKILGRIHNPDQIFKAVDNLQKSDISNLSLDLIYGLPGQSVQNWKSDLKTAVNLCPEHISAYNLIIEDATPFGRLYREGKLVLPDDDLQRRMYESLNSILARAGYARYEISNFAKPGFECRHNLKYWTGKPYLGLGPAAVSFDGKTRRKNKADLAGYLKAAKEGDEIPGEIETVDDNTALEEAIMGGLRLKTGLSLDLLKDRFGYDLLSEKRAEINILLAKEMIQIINGFISIADKALFVSDSVTASLI